MIILHGASLIKLYLSNFSYHQKIHLKPRCINNYYNIHSKSFIQLSSLDRRALSEK